MVAPFTPAECDLQDFPFMPLHVARLRDSDLAAEESAEACWYAVLLWAASWHQIPAGSLPDNDSVLTKLIGLGKDLRTFRKHKGGAMRGFVLCDDGRLYHPIVAEQVNESWGRKLQQRWRTECARIKKHNQRDKTDDPTPTYEAFVKSLPIGCRPLDVPRDGAECPRGQEVLSLGTDPPCPQGNGIQGTGTGTGTLEEGSIDPVAEKPPAARKRDYPPDFEEAWRAYPHHAGRSSKPDTLAEWRRLPPDDRANLTACIARFRPHVASTCGGKGAPDMARWLRQGKHLNWSEAEPVAAVADGDPWPRRMLGWRASAYWNSEWGPKPGKPGYLGPPLKAEEKAA